MKDKDYHTILGVDRSASPDDIKKAYRKLARECHPDVSREANAEERFKEISEAYQALRAAAEPEPASVPIRGEACEGARKGSRVHLPHASISFSISFFRWRRR